MNYTKHNHRSRADVLQCKADLAAVLGPHQEAYWQAMRAYFQSQKTRSELDEQVAQWLRPPDCEFLPHSLSYLPHFLLTKYIYIMNLFEACTSIVNPIFLLPLRPGLLLTTPWARIPPPPWTGALLGVYYKPLLRLNWNAFN